MVPTDGEVGGGGGGREEAYMNLTATLSPHQNDFCIKNGLATHVSHFYCFMNCAGQSHETSVHKAQCFEEKGEPKRGTEPASFPSALTTRPSRLTWGGAGLFCMDHIFIGLEPDLLTLPGPGSWWLSSFVGASH